METPMDSLRRRMEELLSDRSGGGGTRQESAPDPAPAAGVDSPQARFVDELAPWMLQEWRRVSIPEWRRILGESRAAGDTRRAEYAAWMLRDILQDEGGAEAAP